MRRDMDIVRDLLILGADTVASRVSAYELVDDRRSKELIAYHMRMMTEAGLIESYIKPDGIAAPSACFINCLTWSGNELLDAIESDTVWSEVKTKLQDSVSSAPINVITSLATSIITRLLGL